MELKREVETLYSIWFIYFLFYVYIWSISLGLHGYDFCNKANFAMFCYIKTKSQTTWCVPDLLYVLDKSATVLCCMWCEHTFTHTGARAAHVLVPFHICHFTLFVYFQTLCIYSIVSTDRWQIQRRTIGSIVLWDPLFFWLINFMKHFSLDQSRLFQDDCVPSHSAWGYDEYENYINHITWPLQSPDLNPVLWHFGLSCYIALSTTVIKTVTAHHSSTNPEICDIYMVPQHFLRHLVVPQHFLKHFMLFIFQQLCVWDYARFK